MSKEVKELSSFMDMERELKTIQSDDSVDNWSNEFGSIVTPNKKRFCFNKLENYLFSDTLDVCALIGLRRTGKTTLMKQGIQFLMDKGVPEENIHHITFSKNTKYTSDRLISEIRDIGVSGHYYFIDELSYLPDDAEYNSLNLLYDEFTSMGCKIVITGTFSYYLKMLSADVLFDRLFVIRTTLVSFIESDYLLDLSLDEYVKHGGRLSIKDVDVRDYIDSSVIKNIVNSLKKSGENTDKLEELINRAINIYTGEILTSKLVRENFDSDEFGKLSSLINERALKDYYENGLSVPVLNKKDYRQLTSELFGTIDDSFLSEKIFNYLVDVEFFTKIEPYSNHSYYQISQPFLRYYQCKNIINIFTDKVLQDTNNRFSASMVETAVLGIIFEETIFSELALTGRYLIDKFRNSNGWEVDLVMIDLENGVIDLYEIKHSDKIFAEQSKNLINYSVQKEIIEYYENICDRKFRIGSLNVIYRGCDNIRVVNATELYSDLVEEALSIRKTNRAERYKEVLSKAKLEQWPQCTINYLNAEKWLLEKTTSSRTFS